MRVLKAFGKFFWRFMVIFSFIVNFILVAVLLVLLLTIFQIKNNIAEPLIQGLHSSFVGLNNSTIDWTIPVRETIRVEQATTALNASIPVDLDETTVILTQPVPLNVFANINLPGVGNLNNAQVLLTLPEGLELPVSLDFNLPVEQDVLVSLDVPVNLDVRAVIPLSETQLHDPIDNLRLLFEPIVRILGNLPGDFSEVGGFASQVMSGSPPNLLAETPYSQNPWPGYSLTAGLNYPYANMGVPDTNIPMLTGFVPTGGIPGLDEQLRPEVYTDENTPTVINQTARDYLLQIGIPLEYFGGTYGDTFASPRQFAEGTAPGQIGQEPVPGEMPLEGQQPPPPDATLIPTTIPDDLGIVATPVPGG
jgi:hypothetical protein